MSLVSDVKNKATSFVKNAGAPTNPTSQLQQLQGQFKSFDRQYDPDKAQGTQPVQSLYSQVDTKTNHPSHNGTLESGIQEFISTVSSAGVAHPALYYVEIPSNFLKHQKFHPFLTEDIVDSSSGRQRLISLMCEQISFPSYNITTTDYAEHGIAKHMPNGASTDSLSITFRLSQDMWEKKFIEAWMASIVDPISSTIGYASEYKKTISIYQLAHGSVSSTIKDETTGEEKQVVNNGIPTKIYGVKLFDAFPTSLASLDLNSGAQNEYHKLTVNLAFKRWEPYDNIGYNAPEQVGNIVKLTSGGNDFLRDDTGFGAGGLPGVPEPKKLSKMQSFMAKARAIMQTVKGLLGAVQGLAAALYNKLNDLVENALGFRIDEMRTFIQEMHYDIKTIDGILEQDRQSLLFGSNSLLGLLGRTPSFF